MAAQSRYANLIFNGSISDMPKVVISERETDKHISYDSNKMRLDRISASIYGDDTYGWLILLANPQYFMEFDIPKSTIIRIPFPLKEVETEYISKILSLKEK